MAPAPFPVCCPNTRRTEAKAVATASVASILRLIRSIVDVLLDKDLIERFCGNLLPRSVRPDFGFALRVHQISELCSHSPADCRSLAAVLETGEIGTIAPGEWSAQPLPSSESGIMHNVDQPLVIGIALLVAGKIAEI